MPAPSYDNMFNELVILLLAAVAAAVVALRLRQAPIIAFIAVGIGLGPLGLNVLKSAEQLRVLSEMGLALLLFVVGLKLDPQLIRRMGKVSLATGLGQILFTGTIGYALGLAMGYKPITAAYVAAGLVFSSTILIVKLLSDKKDIDSLYGRISVGFLIVEDIVVVLAMIVLSAFAGEQNAHPVVQVVKIVLKGCGLFVGVWAIGRLVFPWLLRQLSRSIELLVLFGVTYALSLAAASEWLGFNKEVGAFVAGLSLASTMYRDVLSSKLVSLRDFLLLFFFLELGSHLDLVAVRSQVAPALLFSLLVLIGKPFIVMFILGRMGYRKRTGFLAGLTVAQISEFSLILVALGQSAGHIDTDTVGLVTLVLMITMGLDVHLIIHAQGLYERVGRRLRFFERGTLNQEDAGEVGVGAMTVPANSVILLGLGRYGTKIGDELARRGRDLLGVDFDPEAVRQWRNRGERSVFGDAEDPDFTHVLPLSSTRWVVSSIRDNRLNKGIIQTLRHAGFNGHFACAIEEPIGTSDKTFIEQIDIVFNPFEDAAVQAADLLTATEDEIARKAMDRLIESMSGHYIVCGYGRMGQQIVKDLNRYNVPCVVVESNPEQLPRLRGADIPHIEGRASEDSVLLQAGIRRAKGLIAVAASDEENVFIVLTAKVLNPNLFVVARSILQDNEDKLRHAGADRVMSPYVLGGRRMAAAVIRPEVMDFLDLVVHEDGEDTEMAVLRADSGSRCVGKTLRDINPWETCGVTLLAVRQLDGKLSPNPSPDLVLEVGDELIVMGTEKQISAARKMLSSHE